MRVTTTTCSISESAPSASQTQLTPKVGLSAGEIEMAGEIVDPTRVFTSFCPCEPDLVSGDQEAKMSPSRLALSAEKLCLYVSVTNESVQGSESAGYCVDC